MALYALARIPEVSGSIRVIEPKVTDAPDLNRYALLRRSRVGTGKADHLASLDLSSLKVLAVPLQYDAKNIEAIGPLAQSVLVGVDDIPSRWAVQAARPQWLGIGATSHYAAMASFHSAGLACAVCLHPRDESGTQPAPTAAFVSHWAGLWLASMFARHASGLPLSRDEQYVWTIMLQPGSPTAVWHSPVSPRANCPIRCPL